MKIAFAAALAALTLTTAGAAFAQAPTAPAATAPAPAVPASRCPGFPAEPTLPDGATARNSRTMQEGDAAYQTWGQAMQTVLECRRAEAEELRIQALTHEARVTEYNAGASRLNAVGQAWIAEAAEYNARTQPRRGN